MTDLSSLPPDLPAPEDDGAAAHLPGAAMPALALPATDGRAVRLDALPTRTVLYAYPRTGEPGKDPLVPDWDAIPGARGCTPEACAFRDHHAELRATGAEVYGLSTQDTAYQREAVERLHLPFPLLSDAALALTRAAKLPTFTYRGMTLIRRMAFVIDDGRITQLFYPVFPPDRSAGDVVAWLRSNRA